MPHRYGLSHLSDEALLQSADATSLRESDCLAWMISHLIEIEERRAYALAGYPSLRAYCIGRLRKSEDAAERRINAARAAREFPLILLVGQGRLHLTAVNVLKPYLRPEHASELLHAACGKSTAEIEQLLAELFPKADVGEHLPELGLTPDLTKSQPAPERVALDVAPEGAAEVIATCEPVPERVRPTGRVTPLGQGRYGIETRRRTATCCGRRRSCSGAGCNTATWRRCSRWRSRRWSPSSRSSATSRPRRRTRVCTNPRHIPSHIRRAVYERDQGQCTYVSDDGHRCEARSDLELDHIVPLARGGQATVDNLRTRCRAHNQLAAEQAFGTAFMEAKREQARRTTEERRRQRDARRTAAAEVRERATAENDPDRCVIPWLRAMGVRLQEARRAAVQCGEMDREPMEQRVKAALARLAGPHRHHRTSR